ncbi:glycosyltransferase family 4 protein [Aureimonas leprariae]|uniref:Glycosyltransferase family 4 protein n=1 Tax=Plantimonas leprariae TaxID=2615207 RepID=A0A7V7PQB7_9HYPH|nr:glycosyltransferase family 4 protein [Aureimonas leprariae]KAB0680358.1 glycosyltransferase family 4 protein [Aureimonas leprariae]
MKALLLVSELEDYTISLANGIARHLPVVLGVPRRQYAHLTSWFEPSVDVRLLDWPRHRSLANPGFLLRLTHLVRQERPSLIHLLSHNTLWLNFAAPFWRSAPLITTIHDVALHPGDAETRVLPRWCTDLIVRQSQHLIVHGFGLRRMALQRYAKRPDRVHVLPHPAIHRYADLARREAMVRRREDGTLNVLLFGRIFAYKGLELLIRAEAALGDALPHLRVTVAGRGDDPWAFRSVMGDPARYDIRNRYIDDKQVAQLFLDADIVVLPYTEASQSGVLNLAAAFGKPVIVTDVGELRDTVEPNGLGMVVPPGDPARLAQAIRLMADSEALRTQCATNARLWATGVNSPENVGSQAASIYRAVAEPRA